MKNYPHYYPWLNPAYHLISVDIRIRKIVLRKPIHLDTCVGDPVYTKQQCLSIIKGTTVEGYGEQGKLIRVMLDCNFMPNKTGLYKLLWQY